MLPSIASFKLSDRKAEPSIPVEVIQHRVHFNSLNKTHSFLLINSNKSNRKRKTKKVFIMNTYSQLVILFFVVACACVAVQALPAVKENSGTEADNDLCTLPMERGVCRASMPRWGYDASEKDCVSFFYGGCFGNANNFLTKEDCFKACKGV